MGVHGLWEVLESVGHPIKVEGLENKILGVDANIWLYKFIRGFREKDNASNIESHKLGLFNRIAKLLYYRIRPVFVFDGPAPVLKRRTLEKRQNTRNKTLTKAQDAAMRILANQLKAQYPNADIDHLKITLPELRSNNLVAAEKLTDEDRELFYLPDTGKLKNSDDESDSEQSTTDDDVQFATAKVDIHSKDFEELPAETRYEILQDIKASRRRIRNRQNLPENANSFSNLQLERLRARRKVQEKIEKCEKEICTNYTGELIDGSSIQAFRVQSDATATILYRNNTYDPKALDRAKKEKEEAQIKRELQQTTTDTETVSQSSSNSNSAPFKDVPTASRIKRSKSPAAQPPTYDSDSGDQSFLDILNSASVRNYNEQAHDLENLVEVADIETSSSDNDGDNDEPSGRKSATPVDTTVISSSPEQPTQVTTIESSGSDTEVEDESEVSGNRTTQEATQETTVNMESPTHPQLPELSQNLSSQDDKLPVEADDDLSSNNSSHRNSTIDLHSTIDLSSPELARLRDVKSPECPEQSPPPSRQQSKVPSVTPIEISDSEEEEATSAKKRRIDGVPHVGDKLDTIAVEQQVQSKETQINRESFCAEASFMDEDEYATPAAAPAPAAHSSSQPTARAADTQRPAVSLSQLTMNTNSQESQAIEKAQRTTNRVTNKVIQDAKDLLRLFGIPYLDAAGEAEAQCAKLEELKLTEGTITDDSDIWLFGSQNVFRYFFSDDKYVMQYKMTDIEFHVRMTRENLACFAMLVGSDYTDGIMNVGPVTALEILSEFPGDGMDPLIQFRDWHRDALKNAKLIADKKRKKLLKFRLPEEFPSRAVFEGYLRPVADTSAEQFSWGVPELDELREYARRNFGWNPKKADEKLLPVMKRLNEKKLQRTIDTFFFKTQANRNPEMFRSKRVNQALNKIAKRAEPGAKPSTAVSEVVNLSEDDSDD